AGHPELADRTVGASVRRVRRTPALRLGAHRHPRVVPEDHGAGWRAQRADQPAGRHRDPGRGGLAGPARRHPRGGLPAHPPQGRAAGGRHAGVGGPARHDGQLDLHRKPRRPGQRRLHLAVSAAGVGTAGARASRPPGRLRTPAAVRHGVPRTHPEREEEVGQVSPAESAPRTALMVHPSVELYGSDRMFVESVAALIEHEWRVVVALPGEGDLARLLRGAGADVRLCPTPVLRKAALRPAGFARLALEAARAVRPMLRLARAVRPDAGYINTVTVPPWSA